MSAATWLAAKATVLALPDPTPTGGGSGKFDWEKVKPDPGGVPKTDLFYNIANGVLWLAIIASIVALAGGAIAFGAGPIFGAHTLSDRGKAMMWKAMMIALVVGSGAAFLKFLVNQ
ncbi:hypothetical protein AB0M43_37700 [Longispora sp. NPDC051575]|uniref:hypothetical protein n=1 Tax=Longispora sp. NPDC051575 TaxID=3154943 RepID=UPI00343B6242